MVNLLHIELLPSNPARAGSSRSARSCARATLWFSSDSIEVKLYRLLQLGAYIMALYFTSTIVIELRRTGPIDFLRRVLARGCCCCATRGRAGWSTTGSSSRTARRARPT